MMKEKIKLLLKIFLIFTKSGAVTFGGGYAMLPILQRELVENQHWCTDEELTDYYAIGQCTPGIIALNVSTFIGRKLAGLPGAIVAAVGFEFVPVILITVISMFLQGFAENEYVQHALAGVRVCVFVLILNAVLKLRKGCLKDLPTILIFSVILVCSIVCEFLPFSIPPAVFVIAAGVAGIVIKQIGGKKA